MMTTTERMADNLQFELERDRLTSARDIALTMAEAALAQGQLCGGWQEWMESMRVARDACLRVAPVATCGCHSGSPDPHDSRVGAMYMELRAAIIAQERADYEATRRR